MLPPLPYPLQADKEEARSQLATATADVQSSAQQLAAVNSARSQAEQAVQELQQLHDKLVAEQAELQAKVGVHSHSALDFACCDNGELVALQLAAAVVGRACFCISP